jgi:uncharacterized protein YggT (Ycf19 family)
VSTADPRPPTVPPAAPQAYVPAPGTAPAPAYPPGAPPGARPGAPPAERSPLEIVLRVSRAVVWVLYAVVVVNTVILTLAFLLRLLGANPDAGFTEWVYRSADRTMGPFRGIFPTHPISDASVLDLSLLFAAIVYVLVALAVDGLLHWLGQKLAEQQAKTAHARAQAAAAAAWRQPAQQPPPR